MKFEKLNDDKIKITLDIIDLEKKNIDFNSFMANSTESQELFMEMLDTAEKKLGFNIENHKIIVEALALNNGEFIFIITRVLSEKKQLQNSNLHIKRKNSFINSKNYIYCFNSFNDFCDFCNSLPAKYTDSLSNSENDYALYKYNCKYYLILNKFNKSSNYSRYFSNILSEFSTQVNNSNLFENKLSEYGDVIFKDNAIKNCNLYFNKS